MTSITTYKGFNKDLTCRKFQFEIGKTYRYDGPVVRCAPGGFHSCENPLDVWNYYGPATSRFALTLASGAIDKVQNEDTKLASGEVYIAVELTIPELVKRAVSYIQELVKNSPSVNEGHGVANGHRGHGVANGHRGHGVANGHRGHGVANGDYGHGVANGNYGHGVANGYHGHGVANGSQGHGVANGDYGHGVANGYHGHGVANGDYGHGVANGYHGHGVANGYHGHGVANGYHGHAEVKGKSGIAASLGNNGTARAVAGSAIVLAGYDEAGSLVTVRSAMVGEHGVEPDKTYTLARHGSGWKFKEVTE